MHTDGGEDSWSNTLTRNVASDLHFALASSDGFDSPVIDWMTKTTQSW